MEIAVETVALALVEFGSIAAGMHAGDAMAKKAPIARLVAGTVHPGKYLVLISGAVADVEESLKAGRGAGASHVVDFVFLPQVHPSVVTAIAASAAPGGEGERAPRGPSLGIIETSTVAAAIHAADAGVKGAEVSLLELRLADGLHGKGLVLYTGEVPDVEAAVEIGARAIDSSLIVNQIVIPQLHGEMGANIVARTRFGANVGEGWSGSVDE
ncbi:MAG TPA: BMC domain-containing protein [Anaerolineae bacterium]|nr:BMC domain-containing protein [Anaerolineae bacterium]